MVFDVDSNSVLHTEMAKKILFIKRGIVVDASIYEQSKCMRIADLDIVLHPRVMAPIVRYQNSIAQLRSFAILVSLDERHGFITRAWRD